MDPSQDQQYSTPKQQVTERLRQANNVLVTVPTNPSVDELAAAIGLTLMLNKLEKHATAVFSGKVPSTLEFLRPEETIETNTDSLRDFIVSLDKSKADKLRYKVEENVVKIFITPYRTSITQDDLEFTQGDFNVDVVIALGVAQRDELDQAITAHGRILHDATVVGVTAGQELSEIGQINWQEPAASSLCEMLVSISEALKGGLIDEQIATAFLTGIVAETERFSNTKTTPKVMTMAAQLMAAGANQQLIANELDKAVEVKMPNAGQDTDVAQQTTEASDGMLSIPHVDDEPKPVENQLAPVEPQSQPKQAESPVLAPKLEPTPQPQEQSAKQEEPLLPPSQVKSRHFLASQPEQRSDDDFYSPLLGSEPSEQQEQQHEDRSAEKAPTQQSEASPSQPEQHKTPEPQSAPAESQPEAKPAEPQITSMPEPEPMSAPAAPAPPEPPKVPEPPATPAQSKPELPPVQETHPDDGQIHIDEEGNIIRGSVMSQQPSSDNTTGLGHGGTSHEQPAASDDATLEDIEKAVHSPHIESAQEASGGLDDARNAVMSALAEAEPVTNPARADLNALPLTPPPPEESPFDNFRLSAPDEVQPSEPLDVSGNLPDTQLQQSEDQGGELPPPPVPPPLFPQP